MMSAKTTNTSSIQYISSTLTIATSLEQSELQSVNTRLQKISERIIQSSPYILTVPTDRPFNLDPRLANDWRKGVPFQDHEERLQYLSFLPDWDHGLITAVGGWDNERGEIMDAAQQQQSARSGTNTPTTAAKKVKLSLKEYQKKAAVQNTSQANTAGSLRDGHPEVGKHVNGIRSTSHDRSMSKDTNPSGQKRLREEKEAFLNRAQSPAKKRMRASPSTAHNSSSRMEANVAPALELPPFISPTLPPAIEKELAKFFRLSKLEDEDAVSDGKGLGPAQEEKIGKSERQELAISQSSKNRTEDRNQAKHKANGASKHPPSIVLSEQINAKQKEDQPLGVANNDLANDRSNKVHKDFGKSAVENSKHPKLSKILKLRIPKSIRRNVDRLLKTPQPRQKVTESSKSTKVLNHDTVVKTIERSPIMAATSMVREKRSRQDEDTDSNSAHNKRRRQPSNLDLPSKPSTPVPPPFRSPVLSHHGSAQRAKGSTPNPDGRSLASLHDYGNVSTPQAAIRNGTPTVPDSAERQNKDSRPTTSASSRSNKTSLSEFHRMQLELFTLGRSLKHSSDRELQLHREKGVQQMKKRGLTLGIESILCFMLSYAIRDEMHLIARPSSRDPTWTTIFPMIARIRHIAEGHTHLRGLCLQLEAVCRMAAWTSECERATSSDSHDSAAHVAMMKHYNAASSLFIDGSFELSVDDLQHSFPDSWRTKARTPLARSNGRFDARVDGDFYLPITSITTEVEAVRAGKSLLVEWCRMEGVEWQPSIGQNSKHENNSKHQERRDISR